MGGGGRLYYIRSVFAFSSNIGVVLGGGDDCIIIYMLILHTIIRQSGQSYLEILFKDCGEAVSLKEGCLLSHTGLVFW